MPTSGVSRGATGFGTRLLIQLALDFARIDHARPEVRPVAEDRVAHVAEMRHLHAIEEQAVFEFAGVAEHAAFADDHVAADDERAGGRLHLGVRVQAPGDHPAAAAAGP